MTFSMYALLTDRSPSVTNETLASDLEQFFRNDAEFSLSVERLPFARNPTLALRWGDWLARVAYEEGAAVEQDSAEIVKTVGGSAPQGASGANRRIRVVFGDDASKDHTNHIIWLLDFLLAIPGVRIYDPQAREFVE